MTVVDVPTLAAPDPNIFAPVGLHVDGSIDFDRWNRLGEGIQNYAGWNWWVGDWWNLGEKFGEERWQALQGAGIALRTAGQCGWVSNKIPEKDRKLDLEWSYHRISAGLPTIALIRKSLKHALKMVDSEEGWSYRKHEKYCRDLKREHEGKDPLGEEEEPERTAPSARFEVGLRLYCDRADEDVMRGILGQLEARAQELIDAAGLENVRVSPTEK